MKRPKIIKYARRALLKVLVPELIWPRYVLVENVKIKIRNTPYSYGTKRIILRGGYEEAERVLIKDQIAEGDVVIEMGGSIGIITALLADKVGETGYIVSVEASEELTRYSRTWLEKNNVRIVTGYGFPVNRLSSAIQIENFDTSDGSLGGTVRYALSGEGKTPKQMPDNIFDLEKLCNIFKLVPTVLMIDVEGSEKIIVSQEPDFPKSVRTIIIELHPHFYPVEDMNRIIERITNEGFQLKNQVSSSYLFTRG